MNNYSNKNFRYYFRKIFGTILKNNKMMLYIYNSIYRIRSYKKFKLKVEERKNVNITEYQILSQDLPFVPIEDTKDSNYYGYLNCLKSYAQVCKSNFDIEHGLMFGDYIPYSYNCKTSKNYLTFNKARAELLSKNLGKKCIAIGPYIHYATPLLDNNKEKELNAKFGRVLLFFPSHSSVEADAKNNIHSEINRILELKSNGNFDTVLVCMYYLDIQKFDYYKYYESAGFQVVTAGHQLDLNFLRRLKSIISLADYVVSSSVGTHIGYCVYMKKPIYIIGTLTSISMPNDYNEIYGAFCKYSSEITEYQYNVASRYWGFNDILSAKNLKQILEMNHSIN